MIKMQKVIKVGNSLAVTLDRVFVTKLGIKVGQNLAANYKPDKGVMSFGKSARVLRSQNGSLLPSEREAILAGKVTPELVAWTDNFIKENKEALEKLANL